MITEVKSFIHSLFDTKDLPSHLSKGIAAGFGISFIDQVFAKYIPSSSLQYYVNQQKLRTSFKTRPLSSASLHIALYPIAEETIYRGLISSMQKENQLYRNGHSDEIKDIAVRTFSNASLFSFAHFNLKEPLKFQMHRFPALFVSGCTFNLLFEATGNLLPPIAAHATTNAIAFRKFMKRI